MKNKLFVIILAFSSFIFNANAQNLRIEIDELSKNLSKYKVIDARVSSEYLASHIKNSLNLPEELTYENQKVDGRITKPNTIQALFRDLGLNVKDPIVVYDDGIFFNAARVFWTLEVYGFKNVKLLNAGFKEWQEKKLPSSNKKTKVQKSDYIASIDNKKLSTKFTTQIATKNPNQVIIDARSYESYIGEKSIAKRFGHIPKAIHIPAVHNLDKKHALAKLKDTESLKKLYKNLNKDKKVVIYCAIGKIAATNYFALRELGYDVSNYDASWKQWGNDFSLPIVNKSKK